MRIVLFVIALSMIAGAAFAKEDFKCPPTPSGEDRVMKRAGYFFSSGDKYAAAGKHQKAVERYLCSMQMMPHENTMYNVTQMAGHAEDPKGMIPALQTFVDSNPDNEFVSDVKNLIESIEAGDPIGEVVEEEENEKEAPAQEYSEPVMDDEILVREEAVDDDSRGSKGLKIAGGIFAGVGALSLGLGIGTNFAALKAKSEAQDATGYDYFKEQQDKLKTFTGVSAVGYTFAGLFGITSFILFYKYRHPGKKITARGPSLMVGAWPRGLTLSGTF